MGESLPAEGMLLAGSAVRKVAGFVHNHVQIRGLKSDPRRSVRLLEDVPKLGYLGEVKSVKPGFARNFLVPQKKAIYASKEILKGADESSLKSVEVSRARDQLQRRLEQSVRFFKTPAGTQGDAKNQLLKPLFATDISKKILLSHHIFLPVECIKLETPISSFGSFQVPLTIGGEQRAEGTNISMKVEIDPRRGGKPKPVAAKQGERAPRDRRTPRAPRRDENNQDDETNQFADKQAANAAEPAQQENQASKNTKPKFQHQQ
eukprot:c6049_g1_i1.p1 GENE.c6049_g1_i1~~c6049_g1_i1.p1  ORF type:complete len:262 (-),score=58.33 c6049_g1_i1:45-830(-)